MRSDGAGLNPRLLGLFPFHEWQGRRGSSVQGGEPGKADLSNWLCTWCQALSAASRSFYRILIATQGNAILLVLPVAQRDRPKVLQLEKSSKQHHNKLWRFVSRVSPLSLPPSASNLLPQAGTTHMGQLCSCSSSPSTMRVWRAELECWQIPLHGPLRGEDC